MSFFIFQGWKGEVGSVGDAGPRGDMVGNMLV